MNTVLPRRFALIRHVDYTGVSGVGVVAYGVVFADGQVVLRWCSDHPATSMWNSVDDLLAVHGHGEATSLEWLDAPHGDLETPAEPVRRPRLRRRPAPATEQSESAAGPEDRLAPAPREQNGHGAVDTGPGLLEPLSERGARPERQPEPERPRQPGRHRRIDPAETRR